MPNPRDVLEKLPLESLKGLADQAGVTVADKRKASSVVDAVAALGSDHLRVLLADLPRATLKDACRALGLDDSGREKLLMLDRLIPLDGKASAPAPAPTAPRAPTGKLTPG